MDSNGALRRRRRKRDSVEFSLFSYVRSQCNVNVHPRTGESCPIRNCHFDNIECLERLFKSARKTIHVAMYQFSVRSLSDALVYAKEKNNVDVQIIVDHKMRLNTGAVFKDLVENDVDVKWPKAAPAMQCLMHHKFILIDAEVGHDDSDDEEEEEQDAEGEVIREKCPQCDSVAQCIKCRPLRIRSKEDLLKFPSDCLPRLPKNGLLITGSHNFSTQAFRENFENIMITSSPVHIKDYLNEFNYLWDKGLQETYGKDR